MAFYEGQSLAEKIRSGPLPPAEAVDIAMQVACGLHAAHQHRVVHRDIKPSNVMLAEPISGSPVPNGVVKIVDFGLAQIISDRTASGTGIEGTVRYMAPEQSVGAAVDHTADQWALGVVLAEMLTGIHPFECATVGATLRRDPQQAALPGRCTGGAAAHHLQGAGQGAWQPLRQLRRDDARAGGDPAAACRRLGHASAAAQRYPEPHFRPRLALLEWQPRAGAGPPAPRRRSRQSARACRCGGPSPYWCWW